MYNCTWPEVAWLPDATWPKVRWPELTSSNITWPEPKWSHAHAQPEVAQYPLYWGLFTWSDVIKRHVTPKGFPWKGEVCACAWLEVAWLPDATWPKVTSSNITWPEPKWSRAHAQPEVAQYPPYWGLFTWNVKRHMTPRGFPWNGEVCACATGSSMATECDVTWRLVTGSLYRGCINPFLGCFFIIIFFPTIYNKDYIHCNTWHCLHSSASDDIVMSSWGLERNRADSIYIFQLLVLIEIQGDPMGWRVSFAIHPIIMTNVQV
jgi:hypothetical protein